MINHLLTEGKIDAVGGVDEQVGPHRGEDVLEDREGEQQHGEHRQGAHAALADHLVDDLLHDQRIHQLKQLHKQRGNQHLEQRPFVYADRRQKPAQAELLLGCAVGGAQHQHR